MMPLTVSSLLQHLTATLDAPEAQVGAMQIGLQDGGLLPADPDEPLNVSDLVTVALALIANANPSRVAEEVRRLSGFLTSGTNEAGFGFCHWYPWQQQGETVRELLTEAITRARLPKYGFGPAVQLRFLRKGEGDAIVLEARGSQGGLVGVYAVSRYVRHDVPARSTSALTAAVENTLAWIAVAHLAGELDLLPRDNASNDNSPVERECAAWWN